ncbi:MAG: hypothetical protein M1837_002448 [Sclerophora amabilis]|nr:MAG: hypothetical protein M1837_002448 [Sclerophora amabilis]
MTLGFYTLPSELLDHILSFLAAEDLARLSQTSKRLNLHAYDERLWQRLIQDCVPGCTIKAPPQDCSFRVLYQAYYPNWFLPKHKIWFSDEVNTGKILIARYDPRRATIDAYRLVAERTAAAWYNWDNDPSVVIHDFHPRVQLHLEDPSICFDFHLSHAALFGRAARFDNELHMKALGPRPMMQASFFLCRKLPPDRQTSQMELWPPRTIPAIERVQNESEEEFQGAEHKPSCLGEASLQHFRLRRWLEFGNVHMGSEVHTYSTLLPELYTPTKEKPWRGIWIGDYDPHGCEFLLMHQPDDELKEDGEQQEDEQNKKQYALRGRLDAIKLTGDPNVPRGQCTFSAEDVGDDGLERVVEDGIFKGSRIIRSKGHIASAGFVHDSWMDSALIMISYDKLAHYWKDFDHISYFRRVDIDQFLVPD